MFIGSLKYISLIDNSKVFLYVIMSITVLHKVEVRSMLIFMRIPVKLFCNLLNDNRKALRCCNNAGLEKQ